MGPHHADQVGVARDQDLLGKGEGRDAADRGDRDVDTALHGA